MSYADGFVIDYDDTIRKNVNCKDCKHYNRDRSCGKKPLYFPVDGYHHWKTCEFFMLKRNASNVHEKAKRVIKQRGMDALPESLHEIKGANRTDNRVFRASSGKKKGTVTLEELERITGKKHTRRR